MSQHHIPVLLNEILEFFRESTLIVFVDGTLGAAGHAKGLLEKHPEIEKYIGFDQDQNALKIAKDVLMPWKEKIQFVHKNFEYLESFFEKEKIPTVDGALFDLGCSSMQLDEKERGFSFQKEAALDMRMNDESSLDAEKVVNEFPEKKLGEIFRDLGEEPKWRKAARAVVNARRKKRIKTTKELADILYGFTVRKRGRHHATLIFQALRIYVNRELECIEKGISSAIKRLSIGGLIGVISFHSLEDRIIKNLFRDASKKNDPSVKESGYYLQILTKKPVIASRQEMKKNPRARSAKLRFALKKELLKEAG